MNRMQVAALAADESHMVLWDIDALIKTVLENKNYSPVTIETKVLIPKEWLTLNKEYAMQTDLKKPLLIFEMPKELLFIADGNHRLYRAYAEKIKAVTAYIIPKQEHLKYLYNCTKDDFDYVFENLVSEGIFVKNPFI